MALKDYLLALLTSILWGGNFIATKYGVDGFGVCGLSLMRVILVSMLFFPYLKFEPKIFIQIIKISLVYGIGFIIAANISIKYADNLPLIIILIQTVVPIGAIMSYYYFKEKIVWQEAVGMCVSFVGVVVLVGVPSSLTSLISIVSILIAAFSQAWQMIMVRKYAKEIDTKNMLAWIHLLNIPLFLVLTLIFDDLSLDFLKGKSLTDWIGGLYSGVISTAIGFGIWFSLLKKYPINKISPFMLFVPFFGILLSVLFFDSKLTTSFLFGGTLIIIGLVIVQFWPYFKSKK